MYHINSVCGNISETIASDRSFFKEDFIIYKFVETIFSIRSIDNEMFGKNKWTLKLFYLRNYSV